ncbi:hypothetical protein LWC34_23940 [Kibdelosporangium philippinense]|uniref:Gram-positive cocci surface proteins LPxTG domain-containing protein n=1 Tax=Kibdelosporangium philippinense TaxID=211113 RepID=A0ABS8ZDD2_9PSEU|nr:hypothetical protein [Kibdelosporangium philippinense]MCE7005856.1 hypothetical protein [Kibdelosporangium philippinense]
MRIRSTVAGLALGAGFLILGAPIAMADAAASQPPTPPTSTRPTETPGTLVPTSTRLTTPPTARETAPTERPRVLRPVGAPETGAGMEESSSPAGPLAIGGIALVAVAAGGSVIYRRTRKQG